MTLCLRTTPRLHRCPWGLPTTPCCQGLYTHTHTLRPSSPCSPFPTPNPPHTWGVGCLHAEVEQVIQGRQDSLLVARHLADISSRHGDVGWRAGGLWRCGSCMAGSTASCTHAPRRLQQSSRTGKSHQTVQVGGENESSSIDVANACHHGCAAPRGNNCCQHSHGTCVLISSCHCARCKLSLRH